MNNVELPGWTGNSAFELIHQLKNYLESDEISKGMSDWIDLIFGYKQKGKEGEQACNLYLSDSYDETFNIEDFKEDRSYKLTAVEMGLTPIQLISKPISTKFTRDQVKKSKQVFESHDLKAFGNVNSVRKLSNNPLMIKMKIVDQDKVYCIYNNNTFNICK